MSGKKKLAKEAIDLAKRMLDKEPDVRTIKGADLLKKTEGLTEDPFGFSKFAKPLGEMEYTVRMRGNRDPYKSIEPYDLVNKDATIAGHISDRTAAGRDLVSVGGVDLTGPLHQRGGADYQRTTLNAWANRQGAAKGLNRKLNEAAGYEWDKGKKQFVPQAGNPDVDKPVFTTPVFMGASSANSSHMVGVPLIRIIPNLPISKGDKLAFDAMMSERFPGWPGIDNTAEAERFMYNGKIPGSAISRFIKYASGKKWKGAGFPDTSEIMFSAMDPRLVGVPQGSSGMGFKEFSPGRTPIIKSNDYHPDYPAAIPGKEYAGGFKYQVPPNLMFPDWWKSLKPELRLPENATKAQHTLMTQVPRQKATAEWADPIMEYWEKNPVPWGYADGGEVDDDINDALRIAKDVGGATSPAVMMEDAKGNKYDAQGNIIPPTAPGPNPQRVDMQSTYNALSNAAPPPREQSNYEVWQSLRPEERANFSKEYPSYSAKMRKQDIAASEKQVQGMPEPYRSMTHPLQRFQTAPGTAKIEAPLFGGTYEYSAPDVTDYITGQTRNPSQEYVQTLYDFKTAPAYLFPPTTPFAFGADLLESRLADDPVGLALNLALTPQGASVAKSAGRTVMDVFRQNPKTIGAAMGAGAATVASDEAEAGPARWFSKAVEAARAIPMNKMTGEQALAMLRKGTSPEELRWMGAEDFLSGQKQVSKDDLVAFLEKNRVQPREIVFGGVGNPTRREDVRPDSDIVAKYRDERAKLQQEYNDIHARLKITDNDDEYFKLVAAEREKYVSLNAITERMIDEQIERMGGLARAPKYRDYSTPGGADYRETLTVFGNQQMPNVVRQGKSWTLRDADNNPVLNRAGEPYFYYDKSEADRAAKAIYREKGSYKSSHWDDPDVLFHTRSQVLDVTPPGANRPYKAWNVDETQSDWGQQGRKQGFKGLLEKEYNQANNEFSLAKRNVGEVFDALLKTGLTEDQIYKHPDFVAAEKIASEAGKRVGEINIRNKSGIIAAPYVTSTEGWTDRAIKGQLDKALDAGSDYFTWSPGDVHAKRYSLDKFIDRVTYNPNTGDFSAYDKDGNVVFDEAIIEEELENYVGKEVADKILAKTNELPVDEDTLKYKGSVKLNNLDLKTGGEGMRGYYDKVYLKRVQEVIRKATGEKPVIETIEVQTADGPRKQLGIRLTDDMREKARFSDFNKGGRVTGGNTYDSNHTVANALALTREY